MTKLKNTHGNLRKASGNNEKNPNGVSTKYLNNYLVWNNLVNYAKESDMEKRNIFLTFVLATLKTAKCRDLSNRPAVPLVA